LWYGSCLSSLGVNLRHLCGFFATSDTNENVCIFTGSSEPFHCPVNIAHYHAINKNLLQLAIVFARSYSITRRRKRVSRGWRRRPRDRRSPSGRWTRQTDRSACAVAKNTAMLPGRTVEAQPPRAGTGHALRALLKKDAPTFNRAWTTMNASATHAPLRRVAAKQLRDFHPALPRLREGYCIPSMSRNGTSRAR
jgi:hypothetical protein